VSCAPEKPNRLLCYRMQETCIDSSYCTRGKKTLECTSVVRIQVKQIVECSFLWMGTMNGGVLPLLYASQYMSSSEIIHF
jgi:hypothetical protein